MFTKEIETNNINGFQLVEHRTHIWQVFSKIRVLSCKPVISKQRNWPRQENKIVMECYLLPEPEATGYRKRMLSLWLNKGVFWVSEQKLVDHPNTICRNSFFLTAI